MNNNIKDMPDQERIPYCGCCATEKNIPRTEEIQTTYCHFCNLHAFCSVRPRNYFIISGISLTKPESGIIEDTYYDTTRVSDDDHKEFTIKASKQVSKILKHFIENPDKEFTPSQIWQQLFDESTPITSCRRAITNLTKPNKNNNFNPPLIKTDNQKDGLYGRPEYTWKLKN